jgi:hypothetical protein
MSDDDDVAPGRRWLGAAFVAWGVIGLFTSQAVELVGSRLAAPFPCALCARPWCTHRAAGHALLHLVGLGVLWFAWSRALRGTPPIDGWRRVVALLAPATLAVATALEYYVEVETVLGTGPILGAAGVALVHPAARPTVRAMGWVCLVTALVGYDVVVLWRLSPGGAHEPLAAVGLLGLAASLVVGVVAAAARSRPADRTPDSNV